MQIDGVIYHIQIKCPNFNYEVSWGSAEIYQWSIILADTDFFQQSD